MSLEVINSRNAPKYPDAGMPIVLLLLLFVCAYLDEYNLLSPI